MTCRDGATDDRGHGSIQHSIVRYGTTAADQRGHRLVRRVWAEADSMSSSTTSKFDPHNRHEGDRQARPQQQRPNQVWRLVVQAQVVHGCSRLYFPAAVRIGGTIGSADRRSRLNRGHDQRTVALRLRYVVHG